MLKMFKVLVRSFRILIIIVGIVVIIYLAYIILPMPIFIVLGVFISLLITQRLKSN